MLVGIYLAKPGFGVSEAVVGSLFYAARLANAGSHLVEMDVPTRQSNVMAPIFVGAGLYGPSAGKSRPKSATDRRIEAGARALHRRLQFSPSAENRHYIHASTLERRVTSLAARSSVPRQRASRSSSGS